MAVSGARAAEDGRMVEAGGVSTFVHDAGDGDALPLLLLHGSGPGVSAWSNWRLVFPGLSDDRRVVAPDQIGFNRTLRPEGMPFGRRTWTDHALAVLESLEIERCDVVGNSMGGAIALSMAAARPEAVRRIVVMGTMGMHFPLPAGLDRAWGHEPSPEAMRELIGLFAHDQSIVTDDLVRIRHEASVAPGIHESFAAMFPAPRQRWVDDLALSDEELAAIGHSVLLVHGWDDQIIPVASTSLKLMEVLPQRRLHVFGDCGHWVMIERTEAFIRLVRGFLDEGKG